MSLETAKLVAQIAQSAAAIAAVVGGALWAYYRFVKSRTFQPRLTVSIFGIHHQIGDQAFLVIKAKVENVGAGEARIKEHGTAIRLWAHDSFDELSGSAQLPAEPIGTYSVFEGHNNAEPLETFEDCKVIQISAETHWPLTIELRVVGGTSVFRAKDVVFPTPS